ncbi:MAG: tetratricopeptide repeat protein [Polyangiaceae bacterium]
MRLRLTLAAIAIVGFATTARADDPAAEALIDQGVVLREQGKDDQALGDFKKAYGLDPSARALAQIGLAEQALGMWRDAERDVRTALTAKDDPWIDKNRGALEGALDTIGGHVGTLEIRADAFDAEVFVDGVSQGKMSDRSIFVVEAGTRNLELRAAGTYPTSRSVVVPARGVARETIHLEKMRAPASTGPTSTERARPAQAILNDPHPGRGQFNIGLTLVGTGVALAVAGAVGIVGRELEVDSYNDDPSCPGVSVDRQPPLCGSKVSTAQTWTTVSIVGFVGAGVLASAGALLILTAPHDEPTTTHRGFGCFPGLGVVCSGRF